MTREHSDARAVPHRSAKGQVWRLQGHAERDMQAGELHASLADLPLPDARQLLSQKGVEGEAQQRWLEPVHLQDGLQHLMPELMRLKDLEKAATRIADAIEQGEEVGLSGDYDCDGNSSVALLRRLLLQSGVPEARIHTHVPNRVSDGYGVNRNAVEAMDGKQVSLLITLDNGTLAYEPIRTAAARGMDTVVIDHHPNSADQELPEGAYAIVNPNRHDEPMRGDGSGASDMAAVGVSYVVCSRVVQLLQERGYYARHGMAAPDVAAWLGLTALATIGDVVSIDSPANRFFVQQGLQQINNGADPAIAQLVFNAQRALSIGEEDIAFTLAPIINAPGRLGQSVAWGFLTGEGAPAELNVHRMFANVRYLQEELDAQRGRIDGIMSNEEARRLRWMLKTQLDDIPDDADAPLSESEQAFVDARRADYKLDAPDQDWQLHGHNQIDPSHHLYMLLSRETNELRKSLEWALLKEARAQAKQVLRQQPDAQTLLVAGEGWNEGLVGIVAGRLKEEYGMPVVAASINAKAGTCKCSGRSIKVPEHPVDIGEAFRTLNKQGVLSKAGGHPMAAGASFTLDKLDAFRAGLEQELGEATRAARAAQRMDVQAVIDLGSLSAARPGKEVQTMQHWLDEAGKLGPFGEGNAKPRVVLSNVYVSDMRRSRDNKHLFFQLRQPGPGGVSVDGVAFHAAGTALEGALDEASRNRAYVAGTLDVREVSRKDGPHTRLQLRLDDVLVPPQRATDRLRRGTTDLSEAMEMPQGDACVPALVRQQGRAAGR